MPAMPPEATTPKPVHREHVRESCQVWAGSGPVTIDVGHHHTARGRPARRCRAASSSSPPETTQPRTATSRRTSPAGPRPSGGPADENLAGPTLDHPDEHLGILDGHCADHDPCDPGVKQPRSGALVADSPTGLHGHPGT